MTLEQAKAAKGVIMGTFAHRAEVVGVGITRVDGSYAVKVNLRSPPHAGLQLPTAVNGVPIRVEVAGSILPQRP